ncbi:MAG: hypothetical protein V8R91_03175 [Butyricimonas faecihominis]
MTLFTKEIMLEPVAISGVNDFAESAVAHSPCYQDKTHATMGRWPGISPSSEKKYSTLKTWEFPFPYRTLTWG